ncbi:TA system VapC family ribonuclease toxin [Variovorax sp. KK3]|uniref:TA system VapC family ribonuclease toxin n=1 Tax=Variovorax sp. KK3 TaxID=1855728 RepID=UPI00097C1FA8|nr:TA system VapC family ribonuclease toxin [Variovorax sp. KK3]
MTPDVNILVAASRSDHPHHKAANEWLEQALGDANRGTRLKLQPMVLASFLRLVTNPKIFLNPTPTANALRFIEAILAAPGVEVPSLGPEWPHLRQLCADMKLAGNDLPDAWLAAAAIHQGEHVVSFDSDFRRLLPRTQFTRLGIAS